MYKFRNVELYHCKCNYKHNLIFDIQVSIEIVIKYINTISKVCNKCLSVHLAEHFNHILKTIIKKHVFKSYLSGSKNNTFPFNSNLKAVKCPHLLNS